jgi:hypothetical protein
MRGGELRVAADRGCGVVFGGVTCVSGHQNGLLETPERWAEIFAEKHLGGAGNDLVGGCGTVTMGETCPALAQPHSVLWTAALGLEGNVTTYQSVAVGLDAHTQRRQCEPQTAAGGTLSDALSTVRG